MNVTVIFRALWVRDSLSVPHPPQIGPPPTRVKFPREPGGFGVLPNLRTSTSNRASAPRSRFAQAYEARNSRKRTLAHHSRKRTTLKNHTERKRTKLPGRAPSPPKSRAKGLPLLGEGGGDGVHALQYYLVQRAERKILTTCVQLQFTKRKILIFCISLY